MEQEIHVIVKVRSSNLNWLLTVIYASPRCAKRQVLWGNLKMMAEVHDMPWVMAGDFNLKKLSYKERKAKLIKRLNAFNSVANDDEDDE